MKLDLHGKSHNEISNIVDSFIWDAMKRNQLEIDIVTGKSERMKDLVIDIIGDYDLNYRIGDHQNNGYIRVFL